MSLRTMKLAVLVAGAATMIANPVFARTVNKHALAAEAFAYAYDMPSSYRVVTVVGWDGRTVGADPDRSIRFQLMRDAFASDN